MSCHRGKKRARRVRADADVGRRQRRRCIALILRPARAGQPKTKCRPENLLEMLLQYIHLPLVDCWDFEFSSYQPFSIVFFCCKVSVSLLLRLKEAEAILQ